MGLAGKAYFDAVTKIGETASVSPVSRELGNHLPVSVTYTAVGIPDQHCARVPVYLCLMRLGGTVVQQVVPVQQNL